MGNILGVHDLLRVAPESVARGLRAATEKWNYPPPDQFNPLLRSSLLHSLLTDSPVIRFPICLLWGAPAVLMAVIVLYLRNEITPLRNPFSHRSINVFSFKSH